MNGSRWYTKNDVLNDLAEMTGGNVVDLDEDCIVRGMKPPPRARNMAAEEDEEMIERFGRCNDRLPVSDVQKPDLHGITKMLRMVDEFENTDGDKHPEKIPSPIHETNHIIITKLNPNVKEFVPVAMRNTSSPKKDIECVKNRSLSSSPQSVKDERLRLLKEKIKQTSKASTPKEKLDRNVAISALMKLASAQPRPSDIPPKPVLIPPEYFEAPRCPKHVNVEDNAEHFIPQSGAFENESTETSSASSVDLSYTSDRNPVEPITVENNVSKEVLHSDPQVKESIEKVNSWRTDEVPKPKPLQPQMGAFIYRKRDSPVSSTPKSPVSDTVQKDGIQSFVPSKHVEELMQLYNKRTKTKDEEDEKAYLQSLDVWERLAIRLKTRDEELRNKQDASPSTSTASGRSSKRRQKYS